jgi:molybdopterin-containing oxidoreductase family iron-sulfur binding subunit
MATTTKKAKRYGMVIDVDRCFGCGACMVACAVENNVPPPAPSANERTGITPMLVYEARNGKPFPDTQPAFFPVMCQQCGEHTPCVSVCPQLAVDVDPHTGIVGQIPERCLGCRYCMAACPYHARYFNWWDPVWPGGMERTLNPDVAPRMRGVVEKCSFCHARYQAAQAKAAANDRDLDPADYRPACVEACPTAAIEFGDLLDETSSVAKAAKSPHAFRLLESIGTDAGVHYTSKREWVREMATRGLPGGNERHG